MVDHDGKRDRDRLIDINKEADRQTDRESDLQIGKEGETKCFNEYTSLKRTAC